MPLEISLTDGVKAMPFSADQIAHLGMFSLDRYEKQNKPVDQINYEHPFLSWLERNKRAFPGGKQYIDEKLRYKNDTNYQWYWGDQVVTYNKRRTVTNVQFPWRGAHDGFSLNEDELLSNGIQIDEGNKTAKHSAAERSRLLDLLDENVDVLHMGFKEKHEKELLRDGSQDSGAIEGLDLLVATDPTTGSPGGINRASNAWWRNNTGASAIAQADLIDNMEKHWRFCIRNGGKPNAIFMGSTALDTFRNAAKAEISKYTIVRTSGEPAGYDPATTDLHFKGVPIVWVPAFEELDTEDSPSVAWEKRIYMLNSRHIRMRPAEGYDMRTRTPPRVYDRYAYYWGLQWKGALCMNRSNAHSVLWVS